MTRALVLSGGGSRGAFQVGALRYLVDQGLEYDIYCGISVGAINAAHLSMFSAFEGGVASLKNLWSSLTTRAVHKRWFPLGYVHSLWELSARNSTPLTDLVHECFDPDDVRGAGNKLRVGAVSLRTNEYRLWTENSPDITDAILASAAFPGMLNPQRIDGQMWIDGGVRNVTPLKAAIDAGADAIDVVMADAALPIHRPEPRNVLDVLTSTLSAMTEEILVNDIKMANLYNQLPGKRQVEIRTIVPIDGLPGEPLEFDPASISAMMLIGYDTARKQLE